MLQYSAEAIIDVGSPIRVDGGTGISCELLTLEVRLAVLNEVQLMVQPIDLDSACRMESV